MSSSLRLQDWSTLQKNLQQWLKHPAVWSGIGSVGAHLFLFALLPFLPGDALKTNPPDLQRSVDLVELTPEERQRLPEFPDEVPIQLPPVIQTPSQQQEQPAPDLFSALPPLPSESIPPLPSFNPLPLPSFSVIPNLPPAPPRISLQIPEPTTPPRLQPNPSPLPQLSPSPEAGNPQTNPSPQPDASPSPSPSPGSEPPQTAANPPAAQQPSPSEQLLARQQELRRLYTYNPEGTSNEAALQSDTGWLQQVSSQLGADWNEDAQKNLAPSKIVELAGAYPRAACTRRLTASVILGVIVDGAGKLVQEPVPPVILRSSGYGIFNQLAIEAVASHTFEATGKRSPYRVLVKFEPNSEVCPPGTVPQPAPENPPT